MTVEAVVWVLIGVVLSGMVGFVLDARSSRRHIEGRIDALGADLRSEMATLGSELRSQMATLGAEVHHMAGQMGVFVAHDHTHSGVSS